MNILWDEPKRRATLAKRGLDLATVTETFFESAQVVQGQKDLLVAIGMIEGVAYAVVFKPLGKEAVSIVTMRRASKKERQIL